MLYFMVTIFLSAFLIFQVQPMIARYILPWFGGTPAVWSTVQMFFQIMLTGGYAYAAWLSTPGKRREWVHLLILGFSVFLLFMLSFFWKSPITPMSHWIMGKGMSPIWEIVALLFISVGLPYFLLSSNSPLLQLWFHRAFPEKTAYRLYAISNIGSLLGLIAYPILIEPFMTLRWQGWFWSLIYLVFATLAVYGTLRMQGSGKKIKTENNEKRIISEEKPIRRLDITLWISLAGTASIMLLAITSQISQEIAVIPFLWVVPLAIYLLTFIVAFSGERWYIRQVFLPLFFMATVLTGWVMGRTENLGIGIQIGIYSLELFCICMICHGELYRLRPDQLHLTKFYLFVSIGGALGGIFITFFAPILFEAYWELPIGITLGWFLFIVVFFFKGGNNNRIVNILNRVLIFSAFLFSLIRTIQFIESDMKGSILLERNFYGVLRVKSLGVEDLSSQRYALVHGITIHGFQYVLEEMREIPTAYFSETGGGGLAILNHPNRGSGMRVGILGLGIGTLATYGQPGDIYRFYEINPQVIAIAEGQGGFFSYLSDSLAMIDIIPGDARLSLEDELLTGGSQNYDILILDVFSSDSIPVHLLDREAFELYLNHLALKGVLAVHISNRHLDLIPIVWTLADHFDLERVVIDDFGNNESAFPSIWMLLEREPEETLAPAIIERSKNMDGYETHIRMWTDDYSNLIQILK